jgi:2-succinyl-6-hydroxy-2,4-cyclohexadiene-1-carboxylate synthase
LVVAGEQDEKFTALGHRLVDGIGPNARFAAVPDAGHAAHLERPAAFLGVLRGFLALDGPAG